MIVETNLKGIKKTEQAKYDNSEFSRNSIYIFFYNKGHLLVIFLIHELNASQCDLMKSLGKNE